ncbi:MAG: hypothetical protein K0R31_99 [Clostridiales bacterium]|jgi:catechol 2,3-dioxygenase-like lactoylglutathione lyase family enzyme|nr:hypothetical protein [Clostridiales bacterium]
MIKGIEHVAIYAKNTETIKDWYVKLFGFKVVSDNGEGIYFIMAPDGAMIEIIPTIEDGGVLSEKVSGLRHIAFYVDNFEEEVEKIKRQDIEVVSGPTITPTGNKLFFFRDPEGNIVQFINRLNPLK